MEEKKGKKLNLHQWKFEKNEYTPGGCYCLELDGGVIRFPKIPGTWFNKVSCEVSFTSGSKNYHEIISYHSGEIRTEVILGEENSILAKIKENVPLDNLFGSKKMILNSKGLPKKHKILLQLVFKALQEDPRF